jgi:hypothetical protein
MLLLMAELRASCGRLSPASGFLVLQISEAGLSRAGPGGLSNPGGGWTEVQGRWPDGPKVQQQISRCLVSNNASTARPALPPIRSTNKPDAAGERLLPVAPSLKFAFGAKRT